MRGVTFVGFVDCFRRAPATCAVAGSVEPEVKRVLMAVLVVVVLFTGIPVVMGMSGAECADCDLGILLAGACLFAVLAVAVRPAPGRRAERLGARPDLFAGLLATSGLYRPPRLA